MDGLSPCLFRERDAALHGGLEAAELFEDLDRALENGPLDPVEFLTDLGGGFGVAGRPGPASHDLPRPLHLPMRARGGDDLNGPALSPKRVPEPAVRRAPGAKRGRGRVAGIDVDEDGALGVQRDRQLDREVAPCGAGGSPVHPDGQQPPVDVEGLERGDLLGFGGKPRQ